MTFSTVLGQQPLSRMIRSKRRLLLTCAFVAMTCYISFLVIEDLIVALKSGKSFHGEKKTSLKEEMLIPGWNFYDIFCCNLNRTIKMNKAWWNCQPWINQTAIYHEFFTLEARSIMSVALYRCYELSLDSVGRSFDHVVVSVWYHVVLEVGTTEFSTVLPPKIGHFSDSNTKRKMIRQR